VCNTLEPFGGTSTQEIELMATVQGVRKSGFLKEFFAGHPDPGKGAGDAAWQVARNEKTLRKARRILSPQSRGMMGGGGRDR
jgi:hypothetical protein